MKMDELMKKILEIAPDAIFDEQDDEIIISTGLTLDPDNNIVPL